MAQASSLFDAVTTLRTMKSRVRAAQAPASASPAAECMLTLDGEAQALPEVPLDKPGLLWQDEHTALMIKPAGTSACRESAAVLAVYQQCMARDPEARPFLMLEGVPRPAFGVVLLALSERAKRELGQQEQAGQLVRCWRAVVHGRVSRAGDELVQRLVVQAHTRSCGAGWVSTVEFESASDSQGCCSPKQLMQRLASWGHPVLGHNYTDAKPLQGAGKAKGLFLGLCGLRWRSVRGAGCRVCLREPVRFKALRDREEKAWRAKRTQQLLELQPDQRSAVAALELMDDRPLAYVLGEARFMGLSFRAAEGVFIPKPASEALVLAALRWVRGRAGPLRVLDLGCGSGALLISTLHQLQLRGVHAEGDGVDLNPAAVQLTTENAKRLGVRAAVHQQSMYELDGIPSADLVLCNPPYLGSLEQVNHGAAAHEPHSAYLASEGGLGAYRALQHALRRTPQLFRQGAALLLEVAAGRAMEVAELWCQEGWFRLEDIQCDRYGTERALVLVPTCGEPAPGEQQPWQQQQQQRWEVLVAGPESCRLRRLGGLAVQGWLEQCVEHTAWQPLYGQEGQLLRHAAWYVAKGCCCPYEYTAKGALEQFAPQPPPEWLEQLSSTVLARVGAGLRFSSVVLNWYPDGQACTGWHSDDERLFGAGVHESTIVSLSLGHTREFCVRLKHRGHKSPALGSDLVLPLGAGELLVMEGAFQKHYLHQLRKSAQCSGGRVNLTWRWIVEHAHGCPLQHTNQCHLAAQ